MRRGAVLREPDRCPAGTLPAMPPEPRPDARQLLAEDPFVRGLARSLLRDAHAAEDLAQETWVAALSRPARTSLRGWVAAVMRRLRDRGARADRRRRERERAAARAELVPSPATIAAREALRAETVRAVLELEPIYRDVVLLRWFENLPPRQIARRLGLPVETVRTRHKRALALLRARLDRHRGAVWCALLVPFARGGGGTAALAAACGIVAGGLLMTTKTKLLAFALVLAGALALAIQVGPGAPADHGAARGGDAAAATPASAALPAGATDPAAAPAADAGQGDRHVVAVPAAPTTGSLLLRAVWGDDRTPAAGVTFDLWRADADRLFEVPRATTGERGCARFDGLPPGRVHLELRRGEANDFRQPRIEIVAGQEVEADVVLPVGMDAIGRVVDAAGRPVAGAEVLASGWASGEAVPVLTAGPDGRFVLRAVGTHSKIGARAEGYAPSPLHAFTGSEGGTVEFTIVLDRPGFALRGTVLDPQQRPVASAVVQAGREEGRGTITLPDGSRAIRPLPARAHTGADGTFAFASVPAGSVPLAVRAAGLAPWTQDVEVLPGTANVVTVRLQPGVTLVGGVRDADGAPVAGASITVGEWRDLGRRRGRSGADGSFRLEGLAAGEWRVEVRSEEGTRHTETMRAAPGETVRCDVVLRRGVDLRGRVLDAEGKPVARAMVEARHQGWWRHENTDAEGRFVLRDCEPDAAIRIGVRRKSVFDELTVRDVVPGAEELVLRLPEEAWIRIRGRIVGPDGEPVANVHVSPFKKDGSGSPAESNDAATGAFDLGPYPPGEYALRLLADGFPPVRFEPRAVGPGEVWDVGTVELQHGGFLSVSVVDPAGQPVPLLSLSVHDADGRYCRGIELRDGGGRAGPFAPGEYSVQVAVRGKACACEPFTVHAGVTAQVDVVLRRGEDAELAFALPEGMRDRAADPSRIAVTVRDARGAVVLRTETRAQQGEGSLLVSLSPGEYRVEAEGGAAAGSGNLSVTAGGENRLALRLQPR